MKIGVVGTGYVGLVSGTCFAEIGNDVVCVDIDEAKVKRLQNGEIPIHEPGLEDLLERNIREGRMTFTTKLEDALDAQILFLALPTPPGEDGSADLSYILGVAEDIGKQLKQYIVVVDKSTVPVGTAKKVYETIAANATVEYDVVSNPEFLREGQAISDFMSPDRVVVGTTSERAKQFMQELYRPLVRKEPGRLVFTDEPSAEIIKYAANGFLATKISFINELTELCEVVGADIDMVRTGMGSDRRIGPDFLYPGPGYGGSCFPKDTLALKKTSEENGVELRIVQATIDANEHQKKVITKKVLSYYKDKIDGKMFALWGLAFKDNTDDIRESPALSIIESLTSHGANVIAFDPQAMGNVKRAMAGNPRLSYGKDEYEVLDGADALIIATNWKEFFSPDFNRIKELLKAPVVFDGRNLYDLVTMEEHGIYYQSIGRRLVDPYV